MVVALSAPAYIPENRNLELCSIAISGSAPDKQPGQPAVPHAGGGNSWDAVVMTHEQFCSRASRGNSGDAIENTATATLSPRKRG